MNAHTPANDTPAPTLRDSLAMSLQLELVRTGWTAASSAFEDACQAAINHDDEAYANAMAEFRRIMNGGVQ